MKPKQRKCKNCKSVFTAHDTIRNWCSPQCGFELSQKNKKKNDDKKKKERRKKDRDWKEKNKSRGQLNKEAQTAFNAFVRCRDYRQCCVSCGRQLETGLGGKTDCGHYRSVGTCPELRFNLFNAHAQCVYCNRDMSGNIVEYRKGLLRRIGKDRLEWLESDHELKKYSHDDLRRIAKLFRKRKKCYERHRNRKDN